MQLILPVVLFSWPLVIPVVMIVDLWRTKRHWSVRRKLLASIAIIYGELIILFFFIKFHIRGNQ